MSIILTLDENSLDCVVPLIDKYENNIKAAEPIFKLEGRRLEEIMRTLPHYQASYDEMYNESKSIIEWIESIKSKRTAKLWKKYNEGYSRQLSTKDIQIYIEGEKEIIELNQILIEMVLIKNNLFSIVDALKQMGWMMGNITKLRISEMQDAIL